MNGNSRGWTATRVFAYIGVMSAGAATGILAYSMITKAIFGVVDRFRAATGNGAEAAA